MHARPSKDDSEKLEQLAEDSLEFQSGVRDLEDTISEVRVHSIRHTSPNERSTPWKNGEGMFGLNTTLTGSQSMKTLTTFTNSYCAHKLWLRRCILLLLLFWIIVYLASHLASRAVSKHINFTCSSAEVYHHKILYIDPTSHFSLLFGNRSIICEEALCQ